MRVVDERNLSGRIFGGPSLSTAFQVTRNESVRSEFCIPEWVTRDEQQHQTAEVAPRCEVNESPRRMELLVDKGTASNANLASTVSLLRAKARDVAN